MSENAGPEGEIVHAHIDADAVAAVSGDGSEPLPDDPAAVFDPYDVPNDDEVDPDPGEAGDPPIFGGVQDDGSDPDAV
jgi:hypothetical protein